MMQRPLAIGSLMTVLCLTLVACQQDTGAGTVRVEVTPTEAELDQGESSEFSATVTGATNGAVTWAASCGTVTGADTTIVYTAPTHAGACSLSATSVADPSRSASATINVREAEPDDVTVSIAPESADLAFGQSQVFTATIEGSDDDAVTWAATCGSVDGVGTTITYTAPATEGTCTLSATSAADPSATATAVVTVGEVGVSIEPGFGEAFVNQSRTFSATVQGSSDTSVTWSLSAGCGSIVPSGNTVVYTAPSSLPVNRCALAATSVADGNTRATAWISVYETPSVGLSATPSEVNADDALTFSWSLSNPTKGLPLTCELYVLGNGVTPTYTIEDCGRGGRVDSQSHSYPNAGDYTASLAVRQGGTLLISASTSVAVALRFVHVSAGTYHSLALDSSGNVWAWGQNANGHLGDGTTDDRSNPGPVCSSGSGPSCMQLNVGNAGTVTAGVLHSMAVLGNGDVWAWGWNSEGQLGDGTTTPRLNPVPVCSSGSGASCVQLSVGSAGTVTAGGYHSLAVLGSGDVLAWGSNSFGQLGDGATTNRLNPVPVCSSGTGVSCVQLNVGSTGTATAGGHHSIAVLGSGDVLTWGWNTYGQLGDGTITDHSNPVPVCSSGSGESCVHLNVGNAGTLKAGLIHSLAVLDSGDVLGWGYNSYGQLGDGTDTSRSNPVLVSKP